MARIERWYRTQQLEAGWTRERFERLCRQVGCPPDELAAVTGMTQAELNRCLKKNKFPRSVSILLALTDQTLVWMQSGLSGPPIMPLHFLTRQRASTTGCSDPPTASPSISGMAASATSRPGPPGAGSVTAPLSSPSSSEHPRPD